MIEAKGKSPRRHRVGLVARPGVVIVPVNIRWSPPEIEDPLRDCRPVILIVDDAFAQLGGRIPRSIGMLRLIHADDGAVPEDAVSYEALLKAASPVEDAMCCDNDLAGIFYTGGTTGRSKGVMLSHGNLMANAFNALADGLFPSDSIYLHAAPMFHRTRALVPACRCAGSGRGWKSEAAIAEIIARARNHPYRIAYVVPEHKLADDVCRRLNSGAQREIARVWRGISQSDPTDPKFTMCRRPADSNLVQLAGGDIGSLCGSSNRGLLCHHPEAGGACAYLRQRQADPEIWIVPAAMLTKAVPAAMQRKAVKFQVDGRPYATHPPAFGPPGPR